MAFLRVVEGSWPHRGRGRDFPRAVSTNHSLASSEPIPRAETYASAQMVTISDTTTSATIYYTTDGTTPSQGAADKEQASCQPGEIYCVRCRAPKQPAGEMAEYQPMTESHGNLMGFCPDCEGMIFRCASMAKLAQIQGRLDITFAEAQRRINGSSGPTVNSDFSHG
jgi:hypothetical protein